MNFERLGDGAEDDPLVSEEGLEPGLEGEVADEFGFGEGHGSRRRIGEGTIVVVGALLIAAGALYGMRWLGSQSRMSEADTTVEAKVIAFLEGFLGTGSGSGNGSGEVLDAEAIMVRLADDRTRKQVPVSEVKKNPFLRSSEQPSEIIEEAQIFEEDPSLVARRMRERLYAELDLLASTLIVSSIMGRDGNRIAVVEDEVVRVGDEVIVDEDRSFKVVRIDAFDIYLECEGFPFMISMDQ